MKRLFIILFSTLLLASCQKDNAVDGGSASTLTYSLSTDVQFHVKSGESAAAGNASAINVLWYGVYHKKADGSYRYMSDMSAFVEVTDPNSINVPISLIKDQEYQLVFVGQHRLKIEDGYEYAYTYDFENGSICVNTDVTFTSGDQLEAFVFVDKVGPVSGSENRKIVLNRVVSQINICTSATTLPSALDVKVCGTPASYNVFSKEYSTKTTDLNFSGLATANEKISISEIEYNRLTTIYCLGSNTLALTLTNAEDETENFIINNVITQVNYKTNITGNILLENNSGE